jgi:hypothetical protein
MGQLIGTARKIGRLFKLSSLHLPPTVLPLPLSLHLPPLVYGILV